MSSPVKNLYEVKSIIPLMSLEELTELEKLIDEKITQLTSQKQAAVEELRYRNFIQRWFERIYELYTSTYENRATNEILEAKFSQNNIREAMVDAYYEFDIEERWIERKILPLYGELPYCCAEECEWTKSQDRLVEYDGSVFYLIIDENEEIFYCNKCIGDRASREDEGEVLFSFENSVADFLGEKKFKEKSPPANFDE